VSELFYFIREDFLREFSIVERMNMTGGLTGLLKDAKN